jgi:signal transduction histidine kinase/ActR/RegA family two-component response regulator/HAMP domain-containing protein
MSLKDMPFRSKLIAVMLLISGVVLFIACGAFISYELLTFRKTTTQNLEIVGKLMASGSTAALAFDNQPDATDVLASLRAEPHIVVAAVYDAGGKLFAKYPPDAADTVFPSQVRHDGYRFEDDYLIGYEEVAEIPGRRLGTLYLKADLTAFYRQLKLYVLIATAMVAVALAVAYVLSSRLQIQISRPVLALAETARSVFERGDYSLRSPKLGSDELGQLADDFNRMLGRIEEQDAGLRQAQEKLQAQLARLDLLNGITRAMGERQDIGSIFQVVIRRLEDHLPIDFGCVCLYDDAEQVLTVERVGAHAQALAIELALTEHARVAIDKNGLSKCVQGQLVYEPDIARSSFPFPRRLANGGLRALVISPLIAETAVFGVLIVARRAPESFSSGDCEFLRQLSEHVALAAYQAKLYVELQKAYEELRQTQQVVLQQERLRALGQMASGVAHDINNSISPIALYTESLLEREPGLNDRVRGHLVVIQRAINDVAHTVSRMKDFYSRREGQLATSGMDLNRIVHEVVDLTSARWKDQPQERGIVIPLQTELAEGLPMIMGVESEIRDALTNLIFNAVDAMPTGGTLTLRTRVAGLTAKGSDLVYVEVTDTGIGMSEEARQRCLEPFYTTKGERGTGMGLAMVYGMTQRHGADLEIESSLGKGTTMRLIFSSARTDAGVTRQETSDVLAVRPLRILIVDDDPLIVKSLGEALTADGHMVVSADGGKAGIEAFNAAQLRREWFDIVITDLGMPYVDGRRVAAVVKNVSPQTPVIMITGWGQRMLDENEKPSGVDCLLAKPPKLRDLRRALGMLTRGQGQSVAETVGLSDQVTHTKAN